jgi:hypothetical protein
MAVHDVETRAFGLPTYPQRTLKVTKWIRRKATNDWYWSIDRVYLCGEGCAKEIDLKPEDVSEYKLRICASSFSPFTTKLYGWVVDDAGKFKGWLEEPLGNRKPFRYRQNERKVYQAHCRHQEALLRHGYLDCDCATINWAQGPITFDKDAVFHYASMPPAVRQQWFGKVRNGPGYVGLMQPSYSKPLARLVEKHLAEKLVTATPAEAIKIFRALHDKVAAL